MQQGNGCLGDHKGGGRARYQRKGAGKVAQTGTHHAVIGRTASIRAYRAIIIASMRGEDRQAENQRPLSWRIGT